MNNSKEKFKCNRMGITLIALVVTIVVLLILASVSITVVFGENGILEMAKQAGEKTNESVKNDISDIGELEDLLHETQTGITVEKVTDTNPGVLEVDSANENILTINSIEDLVFFAYNVSSGNKYIDKTVKLGLSLDFNSTKSYVDAYRTDYEKYGYSGQLKTALTTGSGFNGIGSPLNVTDTSNKSFYGKFDGQYNKIINLYFNKKIDSGVYLGLFNFNYGEISNTILQNSDITLEECVGNCGIAGIAGYNARINKKLFYQSGKLKELIQE